MMTFRLKNVSSQSQMLKLQPYPPCPGRRKRSIKRTNRKRRRSIETVEKERAVKRNGTDKEKVEKKHTVRKGRVAKREKGGCFAAKA